MEERPEKPWKALKKLRKVLQNFLHNLIKIKMKINVLTKIPKKIHPKREKRKIINHLGKIIFHLPRNLQKNRKKFSLKNWVFHLGWFYLDSYISYVFLYFLTLLFLPQKEWKLKKVHKFSWFTSFFYFFFVLSYFISCFSFLYIFLTPFSKYKFPVYHNKTLV